MRSARLWIVAVLSILVALVSYRYLFGGPGLSPEVIANRFTPLGLLAAHTLFGPTALILGPFQFMTGLRRKWPSLHRRLGTVYVVCCLVGGLAGLVLAAGTTAGPIATAGFGLLALFWLGATGQAWRHARARRFDEHERWMIRSFALTLGAVTLRLELPLLAEMLGYQAGYVAVSFVSWVPNALVAEWIIAARRRPKHAPA
jgi:uncharacterized membrane protein